MITVGEAILALQKIVEQDPNKKDVPLCVFTMDGGSPLESEERYHIDSIDDTMEHGVDLNI